MGDGQSPVQRPTTKIKLMLNLIDLKHNDQHSRTQFALVSQGSNIENDEGAARRHITNGSDSLSVSKTTNTDNAIRNEQVI